MATAPWLKFYPQDWRADEKLRLCSLSARGLWIEMLALMHRSERYGQLLISGRVPTDAQLAVQVGAPPNEVTAMLAELESAGVFSRAASGAIYSRRMTRDEKKAKIARQNGKTGGNPNLRKEKGNTASDNGSVKPPDKGGDKPQIPEARSQKPDSCSSRSETLPRDLRAIMDEGGYIQPPGDAGTLRQWYSLGADLQQDILPVIRRVRPTLRKAPFTLKVFDSAIREKLAEDAAEIEHLRKVARRNGGSG